MTINNLRFQPPNGYRSTQHHMVTDGNKPVVIDYIAIRKNISSLTLNFSLFNYIIFIPYRKMHVYIFDMHGREMSPSQKNKTYKAKSKSLWTSWPFF